MSWSARFKHPIAVPSRQPIETLDDARSYVLALGDQVRGTRTWEIALENLLRAAEEGGGYVELARIMLAQAIANSDAVIDKPARAPRRRLRQSS